MTSRKTADYYNASCHVHDADTVIVQGSKFTRVKDCGQCGSTADWCSECMWNFASCFVQRECGD